MAHIYLSSNEIQEIKQMKPINGRAGDFGKCYFYNKDNSSFQKLFKLFYPPGCEQKLHFVGVKSDFISFPIDTYYDDSKSIIGYTIKYFPGRNLWFNFPDNVAIENLKLAYLKAFEVIKQYPNIKMDDLELYNIMYDIKSNAFYLIDTDNWLPGDNTSFENSLNFGRQIMFVFTSFFLRWRDYDLNNVSNLKELYQEYVYGYPRPDIFIDFLDTLTLEVSNRKEEKVKTIGQLK